MRILQLLEAAATGAGRHVVDLTEGLLERGHEVHLLYSDVRSDEVFKHDLRRLRLRQGFQALQLPIRRELSRSDIHVIRALRRHLAEYAPFDMVHCHSTKAGLIGRLGLLGRSAKRLYTPHGFFTMYPTVSAIRRRSAAAIEAVLSTVCHGVITVSREEYAHALKIGIPRAKLCLIPNGVVLDTPGLSALDRINLRHEWGIGENDVCIGFVGRLSSAKSPETMLRSFAALPQGTRTDARLVMVGDGPLAATLHRLADDLGIAARVVWLGASDARPLMGAFDLFALTSDAEGHPLVVLEAMARGLPVVTTSVGGIADTVQHGENGFVAPVRGVQEIAAAVDVLVRDPGLRSRMGQASWAISRTFSVDRMVDRTIALYDQVVSGFWNGRTAADWNPARLG
jgi:glycosyltransferase involved in cell wall biosynthesis